MNQSATIAFFLIFGFIVYVTMKGELPKYAAVIGFGSGLGTNSVVHDSSITASDMGSAQ